MHTLWYTHPCTHNHTLIHVYTIIFTHIRTTIHSPMYTEPYTHPYMHNHILTHVHTIITLTPVCTIITLTYVRTIIRSPMDTNMQTNQTDDNCKHATAANGWSVSVNWFLLQTTHSAHDGRKKKICTRQTGSSLHGHTLSMLLKMACSQKKEKKRR